MDGRKGDLMVVSKELDSRSYDCFEFSVVLENLTR